LYGDRKPDDEEGRLQKVIADAEKTEKNAGEMNTGLQKQLTMAKTLVESLKKNIGLRAPELNKVETDFSVALTSAGFRDEKSFLEARLLHEERVALFLRAKVLDDAQTELNARRSDREGRLASEINRKVTDRALDDLEAQLREDTVSLEALRNAIAGFRLRLSENAEAKERIKEKQADIDAQKKSVTAGRNSMVLSVQLMGKNTATLRRG